MNCKHQEENKNKNKKVISSTGLDMRSNCIFVEIGIVIFF